MKTNILFFILATIAFQISGQETASTDASKIKKGLVKVAILYPNSDDATFDIAYYAEKHMPMVADLFGEALRHYAIDKGVAGRTPEEPIPYVAVGYFYFDQLSDYENAFGANAEKILGDIPNYTNIQPVVQISEVVR
ncbi:EthD family reductase [Allomuricauda sp. d1]|uniref:EthD family reductase n=1 Tax=Allomuricauda sp. d1 TaxID=3136725 RepID=UPI0031D64ED9